MVLAKQLLTIFGSTGEEAQGIAALGIDPLAIIAQGATFLILFFILKKFALEKIVKTLEDRRKTIDDGVRLGREMEAEKDRLAETITQELKKARKEADKIIAMSREESNNIVQNAQEVASRKAEQIVADAHAKIQEDIVKARATLQREVLELVSDVTEMIIDEKLDTKKDDGLIKRALVKVGLTNE